MIVQFIRSQYKTRAYLIDNLQTTLTRPPLMKVELIFLNSQSQRDNYVVRTSPLLCLSTSQNHFPREKKELHYQVYVDLKPSYLTVTNSRPTEYPRLSYCLATCIHLPCRAEVYTFILIKLTPMADPPLSQTPPPDPFEG